MIKECICQICGLKFKSRHLGKFCSRRCLGYENLKRIKFSLSELTNEERFERLRKSFESKVIKKEGCWAWNGAVQGVGYHQIRYGKRKEMAHRVSWMLYKGEIPEGLNVLHTCDNRRCTNPDHLFLGTAKDNAVDRQQKNRGQKGITHNKCKLSENDVKEIKKLLKLGVKMTRIAEDYEVTNGTIWFISKNLTWKHITE